MEKVSLQKAELWYDEELKDYFLRLEYLVEDYSSIIKMVFPKVEIGIPRNKIITKEDLDVFSLFSTRAPKLRFNCGEDHNLFMDKDKHFVYEILEKEKVYDMTLEEIEKKIGCKIRIV